MAKICKDFTYDGKKISDLSAKYIFADFDDSSETSLSLSRSNISGETNLIRREANDIGTTWDNTLEFEFDIAKDPCLYATQEEREITKADIREITRWLTSVSLNKWLDVEAELENDEATRFLGKFSDIQTWVQYGTIFGLKLLFRCSSQFGFTNDMSTSITVGNGCSSITIDNDDDELDKYVYPTMKIEPNKTGQIFFCNMSDTYIFEKGGIDESLSELEKVDYLMGKIGDYGNTHGYKVDFLKEKLDDEKILVICDKTAIPFKYIDSDNNEEKCIAYIDNNMSSYHIVHGAFMYLNVYKSLTTFIDCERQKLYDDTGRMIRYDDIGISDEDYIYFLRYLNGENKIVMYGNDCKFTFTHREARKTGGV